MNHMFVPVVDREQRPLMPTTPARARRWIKTAKAPTHQGKRRWNRDFSPLQVGKHWFYKELGKLAPVRSMQGFQTKELRVELGLKKTSNKMAEVWQAHCVDAWVLAHAAIGGCKAPDNTRLVCIAPLIWHRRQLHKLQPAKGGTRRREGGTLSLGIKRGTLVNHPTWGKAYVGGTMNGKLSLHALRPGKRITQSANMPDCTLIKLLRWRTRIVPYKKVPVSSAQKERTPVFSPVGTGHPQAHIGEFHGDARP